MGALVMEPVEQGSATLLEGAVVGCGPRQAPSLVECNRRQGAAAFGDEPDRLAAPCQLTLRNPITLTGCLWGGPAASDVVGLGS